LAAGQTFWARGAHRHDRSWWRATRVVRHGPPACVGVTSTSGRVGGEQALSGPGGDWRDSARPRRWAHL